MGKNDTSCWFVEEDEVDEARDVLALFAGSGRSCQTTFTSIGQPRLFPSSPPSAKALGRLSSGEDRYCRSHRHRMVSFIQSQ